MTPESWNSPLLENGWLKCVSAVMDMFVEIKALLRDGRIFCSNRYTPNNRPAVSGRDLHSVHPEL